MLSNTQSKTHYQPQVNFSNCKTSLYFPTQSAVLHAKYFSIHSVHFNSFHFPGLIISSVQSSTTKNNTGKEEKGENPGSCRIIQLWSSTNTNKIKNNKKTKNKDDATLVLGEDSMATSSNAKAPRTSASAPFNR